MFFSSKFSFKIVNCYVSNTCFVYGFCPESGYFGIMGFDGVGRILYTAVTVITLKDFVKSMLIVNQLEKRSFNNSLYIFLDSGLNQVIFLVCLPFWSLVGWKHLHIGVAL